MKLRRSGEGSGARYHLSAATPDAPAKPVTFGERVGVAVVIGLFALTAAMGLMTVWAGIRLIVTGEQSIPFGLFIVAMGLVFSAAGLGFFYIRYVKTPIWDAQKARQLSRYPNQPWMLRKDWAARRIVHSNLGLMLLLWIWNVGWWGALALIGTVNRDKIVAALDESWWGYVLAAFFVLVGLAALRFALAATWAYWRFGRSVLRLDTLPAFVGDRLRGAVEARLAARPTTPLKASLVCERLTWIDTRRQGKTTSRLEVQKLARLEREIAPSLVLLSRSGARIPVEIDIPAGSPDYALDSKGNGIRWTLHIEAQGTTEPFSCTFEVPVYARRP